MVTDEDVEVFLSHYGVKGMKWGVRNDRRSERSAARKAKRVAYRTEQREKWASRTGKQKAGLIGGTLAGYYGGSFVAALFGARNPVVLAIASSVGARQGLKWTENYLDKKGDTEFAEIDRKLKSM